MLPKKFEVEAILKRFNKYIKDVFDENAKDQIKLLKESKTLSDHESVSLMLNAYEAQLYAETYGLSMKDYMGNLNVVRKWRNELAHGNAMLDYDGQTRRTQKIVELKNEIFKEDSKINSLRELDEHLRKFTVPIQNGIENIDYATVLCLPRNNGRKKRNTECIKNEEEKEIIIKDEDGNFKFDGNELHAKLEIAGAEGNYAKIRNYFIIVKGKTINGGQRILRKINIKFNRANAYDHLEKASNYMNHIFIAKDIFSSIS